MIHGKYIQCIMHVNVSLRNVNSKVNKNDNRNINCSVVDHKHEQLLGTVMTHISGL